MTASCRSEIKPKASEAAGNNTAYSVAVSMHLPLALPPPALGNTVSRENDVCFWFLFPFFHTPPQCPFPALAAFFPVILDYLSSDSIRLHVLPVTYRITSGL